MLCAPVPPSRPASRRRRRRSTGSSGGRLDLGLGAGWFADEFTAFGYRFGVGGRAVRAARGDLRVPRGAARRRAGGFRAAVRDVTLRSAQLLRGPCRSRRRCWVGGKGGPRLLRLAAASRTDGTRCGGGRPRPTPPRVDGRRRGVRAPRARSRRRSACRSACSRWSAEDEADRAPRRWERAESLDAGAGARRRVAGRTGAPTRCRARRTRCSNASPRSRRSASRS